MLESLAECNGKKIAPILNFEIYGNSKAKNDHTQNDT
jgi:hypothetical protein